MTHMMMIIIACRYGADAIMYGLLLRHGAGPSCEDAAVQELIDMLKMVCLTLLYLLLPSLPEMMACRGCNTFLPWRAGSCQCACAGSCAHAPAGIIQSSHLRACLCRVNPKSPSATACHHVKPDDNA